MRECGKIFPSFEKENVTCFLLFFSQKRQFFFSPRGEKEIQLSQNLSKREEEEEEEEEEEKLVSREYKRRHVFRRSEDASAEKTNR